MPAETGEGHGQKVDLALAAPDDVGLPIGRGVDRGGFGRAVSARRPRRDHVGERREFEQCGIGDGIPIEGAPPARHAEHDRESPALLVVLEKRDDLAPVVERRPGLVIGFEAAAPEREEWFTAMAQVRAIAREPGITEQFFPIGDQHGGLAGGEAAQIIHERVDAAVFASAGADVFQNGVIGGEGIAAFERIDEALEKNAVDAMLFHPRKMAHHRRPEIRAEHFGPRAVGVHEPGWKPLGGGKLRQIRPHIHPDISGGRHHVAARPMIVAALGAIALGVEPTLIADHHFTGKRGGIDGHRGRSGAAREQRGNEQAAGD